jgi:hypothetical protein
LLKSKPASAMAKIAVVDVRDDDFVVSVFDKASEQGLR